MNLEEMLQKLNQNLPPQEAMMLLGELSEFPDEKTAKALIPVLQHSDYLVKSKAFVVLEKVGKSAILPELYQVLQQEQDEEFRFRALAVIQAIGDAGAIPELAKFLHDRDPLIIRGTLVALGGIGGPEAVRIILEFASSPQGRIVRRELVEEVTAFALQKVEAPEQLVVQLAEENSGIRRYIRGFSFEAPPIPHFTVYPGADYFSLQAKERGVSYKDYKRRVLN